MRPTISDLAHRAGVSTATVDRVLNNRAGVTDRTRNRVLQIAQDIGYVDDVVVASAPSRLRLAALLPAGDRPFAEELERQLDEAADIFPNIGVTVTETGSDDPAALAHALEDLSGYDGIIVSAIRHPSVSQAINAKMAENVPVVTLGLDLLDSQRIAYIGADNAQAGRLAGQVIGRFADRGAEGQVAVLIGPLTYLGHLERDVGLRQIMAQDFPKLHILPAIECRESDDTAQRATAELLQAHPDLRAIYLAGAGSAGVALALAEAGRKDDVIFVAHDNTGPNRRLLLNGTLDAVLDQSPRTIAREAIGILISRLRQEPHAPLPIRWNLTLQENMPEYIASAHLPFGPAS